MAKKATSKPSEERTKPKAAVRMYHFMLNPYLDERLSVCPSCGEKSSQRKTPLVIQVDSAEPVAIHYTCRFCAKCDLLMGHRAEIEGQLTDLFRASNPQVIGNGYRIIGTLERKTWRSITENPQPLANIMHLVHPFKGYRELQRTQSGWFQRGVRPPLEPAPPSLEWVKQAPRKW